MLGAGVGGKGLERKCLPGRKQCAKDQVFLSRSLTHTSRHQEREGNQF